jgi:hypothetical protein
MTALLVPILLLAPMVLVMGVVAILTHVSGHRDAPSVYRDVDYPQPTRPEPGLRGWPAGHGEPRHDDERDDADILDVLDRAHERALDAMRRVRLARHAAGYRGGTFGERGRRS